MANTTRMASDLRRMAADLPTSASPAHVRQRIEAMEKLLERSLRIPGTNQRFGLDVRAHPFPDHHRFTPRELDFGDELPVLMTEKDAVKLRHAARPNWWVLPVTARLTPAFGGWLLGKLDERRRSKAP